MTPKLPKFALNLKQFMLRQEVLKLYREIQRTIRHVPDEQTRKELYEWARSDFKNNKYHVDERIIKTKLLHGRKSLKDLQGSLILTK